MDRAVDVRLAPIRSRRTSRMTTRRWCRTWARSAKVARRDGAERPVRPVLRGAGGGGGGPVDADPDQLALRLGDLLGGLAEQGDRGAPGDEPAQVGGERRRRGRSSACRARARRRRRCGAQVDHPLAGLDPPAQLCGVGRRRWGQVRRRRAGGVGRPHVRVVGRVGVQPGEQLGDVGLLVLGQGRVRALLLPDRRGGRLGLGGRAEAAEPVGGQTSASSGSSAASRCAEAYWWRTRSWVCSGPSRSGRPVEPYSSDPPVKTAGRGRRLRPSA